MSNDRIGRLVGFVILLVAIGSFAFMCYTVGAAATSGMGSYLK